MAPTIQEVCNDLRRELIKEADRVICVRDGLTGELSSYDRAALDEYGFFSTVIRGELVCFTRVDRTQG